MGEIKVGTELRAPAWVSSKGKSMAVVGECGAGGGVDLPPQYLENAAEFRRGNRTIVSGSAEPTTPLQP